MIDYSLGLLCINSIEITFRPIILERAVEEIILRQWLYNVHVSMGIGHMLQMFRQ